MISRLGWAVWAVLPVIALAFHFGPGQQELQRDTAARALRGAAAAERRADEAQSVAHAAQLARIAVDRQIFLAGDNASDDLRAERVAAAQAETEAYAVAAGFWKQAAENYRSVEDLLGDTREGLEVRWVKARALVRAGEIWNGIDEFQSILDVAESAESGDAELAVAVREELAVANYYGARLLRQEGRPGKVWREVSALARQQYRYLAERAASTGDGTLADSLQRNLERVLDLEQMDPTELTAVPLPQDAPLGRASGDRGPGSGPPGRGSPSRRGSPGNGAGAPLGIGVGW